MRPTINVPTSEMFAVAAPYGEALFQLFKQGWSNIHAYNIIKNAFPWFSSKQWSFLYNVGKYLYYRWRGWVPVDTQSGLSPQTIPTFPPEPNQGIPIARYRAGIKIYFTNIELGSNQPESPLLPSNGLPAALPPNAETFYKELYVNLNDPVSVEEIYKHGQTIVNQILITSPTFDSYGNPVTPNYYGIEIRSLIKRW